MEYVAMSWIVLAAVVVGLYEAVAITERATTKYSKGMKNPVDQHAFCENDHFNATCKPGHVIMMTVAKYGRMQKSKCVILDYGHIGCGTDVLEIADNSCSGRRHCSIRIPDARFSNNKCPGDLKPYFQAEYRCVKVETAQDSCLGSHGSQPIRLQSERGYLANVITEATGCGGRRSPWIIEALPGQNIAITLLDYNVNSYKSHSSLHVKCTVYAHIQERLSRGLRNVTVCGGQNRERGVYTSVGNRVEVAMMPAHRGTLQPYFMLKYEAVGCADVVAPPYSHLIREGKRMTIYCNHTKDVYSLKCIDSHWHGSMGNCSEGISYTIEHTENNNEAIPYGMSILIVLAIALTIGLFVLLVGLIFLRRQRGLCMARQPNNTSTRLDPDDKDYVSAMWIRNRESPSASSKWSHRDTDTYSTYISSELPPCTPLMERGPRPPLYGQLQAQKLPCGCSTYVDSAEVSDYVSRQQLLASQGGRPEKIILRPGEPAQYFIVEAERPKPANRRSSVVMQTDDIKIRLRGADDKENQPLMEGHPPEAPVAMGTHEQQGPPPDVSYSAICKELIDNEVNDEQAPRCSHMR